MLEEVDGICTAGWAWNSRHEYSKYRYRKQSTTARQGKCTTDIPAVHVLVEDGAECVGFETRSGSWTSESWHRYLPYLR